MEGVGQAIVPPLYKEQAREAAGRNLTFGIRPEHLEDITLLPPDAKDESRITAPVEVVEHLGNELLVYMTAAGRNIVARLDPRSSAHSGGQVTLHIDTDQIHLFDTDTGSAIF